MEQIPGLNVIGVVPRCPDSDGPLGGPVKRLGQRSAIETIRRAAPDRFGVFNLEPGPERRRRAGRLAPNRPAVPTAQWTCAAPSHSTVPRLQRLWAAPANRFPGGPGRPLPQTARRNPVFRQHHPVLEGQADG